MKPWAADRPDDDALRRLVDEDGLSDREIGDMYGVTSEAVRYWRNTSQPPIEKNSPKRFNHREDGAIPWVLDTKAGHHKDALARTLRARNRLAHGLEVPADMAKRVAQLEDDLASEGMVIDYERSRGFFTRRRDSAVDDPGSIVRQPST